MNFKNSFNHIFINSNTKLQHKPKYPVYLSKQDKDFKCNTIISHTVTVTEQFFIVSENLFRNKCDNIGFVIKTEAFV